MKILSLVLVSYNSRDYLEKCLDSIMRYLKTTDFEVIVVDNNSTDTTVELIKEKFPFVKLLENKKNYYFCRANNIGWRMALGKYVVFMNPDIELVDDSLLRLIDFMEKDPRVVAVEPAQYTDKNSLLPTGTKTRQFVTDLLLMTGLSKILGKSRVDHFLMSGMDRRKIWEAEVVSGACLVTRRRILKKIGGFPKNIQMYFSEDALCDKLRHYGKIYHLGTTKVRHFLSTSTNKLPLSRINWWFARDGYFFYKNRGEWLAGAVLMTMILGSFHLKSLLGRMGVKE